MYRPAGRESAAIAVTGGQTRSHIFFENSDSGSVPAVTRLPSQRLSNDVPVRFEDALLVRRSFDAGTYALAQDDNLLEDVPVNCGFLCV